MLCHEPPPPTLTLRGGGFRQLIENDGIYAHYYNMQFEGLE